VRSASSAVARDYVLDSFIVRVNATCHVADRDWLIASREFARGIRSSLINYAFAASHRVLNRDKESRDTAALLH